MNCKMVYKPYRADKVALYMMMVCMAVALWIFGVGLIQGAVEAACFGGIYTLFCIILIKNSLSRLMLVICFEENGIHVIRDGNEKNYFVSWDKFLYGYYCTNYRGFPYLVLTDKKMNNKQTRKLVQSRLKKQFIDGNVVISLAVCNKKETPQIEEIKKIISEKIPNVREYKYFD